MSIQKAMLVNRVSGNRQPIQVVTQADGSVEIQDETGQLIHDETGPLTYPNAKTAINVLDQMCLYVENVA